MKLFFKEIFARDNLGLLIEIIGGGALLFFIFYFLCMATFVFAPVGI